MDYISTRGEAPALTFSEALLAGLARDGGLYVPREWPQFSKRDIRALRGKSYQEIAFTVLSPFVGDEIEPEKFRAMIDEAYATFRHPAVAPLVQTGPNAFILELFHGTTLAFKDVAMQLLARLMDFALGALRYVGSPIMDAPHLSGPPGDLDERPDGEFLDATLDWRRSRSTDADPERGHGERPRSKRLPALVLGYERPFAVAGVDLLGAHDLLVRIGHVLQPLRAPACRSWDGEQHGEHLGWEAQRLIDQA